MRKAGLKRDLSYHEGAYAAITEILFDLDALIIESCHYRENDKLWRLRDNVTTMHSLSLKTIKELEKELNK